MRGKVRMFGKTLPAWAVGVALILATSGAAVGVVLTGNVTGVITATASQSLLVSNGSLSGPAVDAGLFTLSDDGTKFTAGAEINTGDKFDVDLALANASAEELTGELTLVAPSGVTLLVREFDDITGNIVRTGPFTWKFRLPVASDTTADMRVTVALADDMPPGFYAIDGTLKQVAQ
ncbi:MAG: hypothetical protein HY681_14470 [Chloroflexi bacterium]|nr:hypothetical protein [Chloroflexota bacterium]